MKIKKSVITFNAEMRDYTNAKGLRQVVIRITQNKKHTREHTGISIDPKFWTDNHGKWISQKHPNHKKLNITIQEKLTQYQNAQLDLEKELGSTDKIEVYNAVNNEHLKHNFLAYWDKERAKMKEYNNSKGYDVTRKKILAFTGTEDFTFKSVNADWLTSFDSWMFKNGLEKNISRYSELRRIRKMWNLAITAKIMNKGLYPFGLNGGFRMPNISTKSKKIERLNEVELKALFSLKYKFTERVYFAHKGFELAFNMAGIRIEDLLTLKKSNIKDGRISYHMKKGVAKGKYKTFEITSSIKKILKDLRIQDLEEDDYLLPFLKKGIEKESNTVFKKEVGRKTALYNKFLKRVANDLGITKNLTSHLARHSWSAYTYSQTKDYRLIQQNLDHEDIKVTMDYIGNLSEQENDVILKNLTDNLYSKAS